MLTAVSGVECHGQTSSWAAYLLQANEVRLRTQRQLWCGRSHGPCGPRLSLAVSQQCDLRLVLRKGEKETSIC